LRAIDNNTLLSKLPVSEQGNKNDTMISAEDLHKIYSDYPQIITNTKQLLNRCSITFDFKNNIPNNQKTYTNNEILDFKLLQKLAYQGLNYRYKKLGERIFNRLEKELKIYDYRILYTLFSHLQETEAMTTLSKTESKYLLLNL